MEIYETFKVNGKDVITDEAWMEEFIRRVKFLKKKYNLSYSELSRKALLHPNTVQGWVRNKHIPRVNYVFMLAAALNCSPAYLFCLTDKINE